MLSRHVPWAQRTSLLYYRLTDFAFTCFTSVEVENTAGFTPAKLVSGLYQAFVFRISEQTGHLVGHFVIETGILSIAGNDDIGPISATLQQIVTIIHLQK